MPVQDRARRDETDRDKLIEGARELATRYARLSKSAVPVVASVLAFIFSAVSLYQTVIKQAHLHLFVPDAIAYTRDPDGGYEVFAVPLTISNSGARDGIVSSITLEVRNSATGIKQTLEASYFAGADYFSAKEDPDNNRRQKIPFAPLSVAGRGSATATVLFYARQTQGGQQVVPGQGRFEVLMTAQAKPVEALGFVDSLWSTAITPMRFVYELPPVSRLFDGRMYSGKSERMFRVE